MTNEGCYDHVLKSENPWFTMVWNDEKSYDIRESGDRVFAPCQNILFREYDKAKDEYLGRSVAVHVVSVTKLNDITTLYGEKVSKQLVILSTESSVRIKDE